MNFVVKLFPEITIKSRSVRKQMTKVLRANLRTQLKRHDISADVQNRWDSLVVVVNDKHEGDENVRRHCLRILTHTPGIGSALEVTEHAFESLPQAYELIRDEYRDALSGKSFCVRIKRAGQHDFTSHQAEIYMGGGLLKETGAREVSLKQPEITVRAEIRNKTLQIVGHEVPGLGGFPLGSQGEVLSLISGGFDSTVSSYLMNRRGLKTHYLFFNLGGSAHEIGVKQVAHYLWSGYGESHRVKFVSIPFEAVVSEILQHVDTAQMGVVLKRMMLRAASQVAFKLRIPALVTGEAVAQVASQTITNLAVIDQASEHMVLRPLAAMDKQEIINIARQIGTETFAAKMPEYCGVISVSPTTVGDRKLVEKAEQAFDMEVLTNAIRNARVQRIDEVLDDAEDSGLDSLEQVYTPALTDVIIDIRHPNESQETPLHLTNNDVLNIPFYELDGQVAELPEAPRYLLYCQQGTMSKIHAHHLNQQQPGRFAVLLDPR